jgi:hypothetical protein
VLAKINRAVGTRAAGITAPATYELPPDAVGEAIVNAIAHRDYHSNASVEVRLFADRLEVWNPGALPGTLTLNDLRDAHPSVPNNPLLAESLYLTRYIEKAGSGTQRMIELCREAGLPEPDFQQRAGSFVVTPQARRRHPQEHPHRRIPVGDAEERAGAGARRLRAPPRRRRNRDLDPQLVWRGKDQQDWSDLVVHAPPLYIQEKVHPKVLIDDLLRQSEGNPLARREGGG